MTSGENMNNMKKLTLATATATLIALSPLSTFADDKDMGQQLREARQEGSIWTAFALNRHLSPFSIDVDVESGTAVLTGNVESEVDRDLAEQVALGTEGIERVDNQLKVDNAASNDSESRSELSRRFEDATITATVKSKLLWNRNTEGLNITVNTEDGMVTLTGTADNSAAKELAQRLADNTDGVRGVKNDIQVNGEKSMTTQAQSKAKQVGDEVSDAWITSKVKSSYLLSSNLSGLDISVNTENAVVTLTGQLASAEEKNLAVHTAENIRGVSKVNADNLRVAN